MFRVHVCVSDYDAPVLRGIYIGEERFEIDMAPVQATDIRQYANAYVSDLYPGKRAVVHEILNMNGTPLYVGGRPL